ncbi:MAG: B12-binding domain-containing radical SAM protein [Desulfobacterota bacterium]|nr:B12-binding domain-containing radical SAM protein [Thermodesulfobacteriota bacterium]MDW8001150.1 radical SAM protein [Deltaproteobacteria bacterium]
MKRIVFVYPNVNTQIGFNYGISFISSVLKMGGIETKLININEKLGYPLDYERIVEDVLNFNPDLIGFSVLTNQYKYASEIAKRLKKKLETPIIFGGIHPTMDPIETLKNPHVDYICMGEGEEAILELANKGEGIGIKNIGYKKGDFFVLEPLRPFTDISKLPFKDYEIFDFQKMIDAKDGWVGLLASRGCPFRCTYCLNHKIIDLYRKNGHLPRFYIRRHKVEEVLEEIEYLLSKYRRIKMFIFDDDIFTFDKEWLYEFAKNYKKVTKIGFVCNAHPKIFDEEIASLLKEAGCRIVKFGLESGSERIRKGVLKRFMSNADIEKAFSLAHKYGLHTSAFVMLGLPHETVSDLLETVKLLAKIKPGRMRWSLFFPFVGTEAYKIAKENNMIDFEKMVELDNFTDGTCMRLGDEVDLLIEKLKTFFCAFVNAHANADTEGKYMNVIEEIMEASKEEFELKKEEFLRLLETIDSETEKKGRIFYKVKYNPFMGVRSDWKDDSLSS